MSVNLCILRTFMQFIPWSDEMKTGHENRGCGQSCSFFSQHQVSRSRNVPEAVCVAILSRGVVVAQVRRGWGAACEDSHCSGGMEISATFLTCAALNHMSQSVVETCVFA